MRRRTSAYTLMEVLVWVSVLSILMSLLGAFLVSAFDANREAGRAVESAEVRLAALKRLGQDVRSAGRILAESNATTLFLERPDATHVLYWFEDGLLRRQTGMDTTPVGRMTGLTFGYDGKDAASSRWVDLALPGKHGGGVKQRFYLMKPETSP